MNTECAKCNGKGLVSTGANSIDLDAGRKEVCPDCKGTGQIGNGSAGETAQQEEAPKEPSPAEEGGSANGSEVSSAETEGITPQEGDACLTADNQPGKLAKGENGWICVPEA